MIRCYYFLLMLSWASSGFAQFTFRNLTIEEALAKAGSEGKMVLVEYVAEDCFKCDDLLDATFSVPDLQKLIEQKCVAIKLNINHPDWSNFTDDYNNIKASGSYFFSPLAQGEWIHAYKRMSPNYKVYINEINKAWDKQVEGMVTFAELEKEWNEHPNDIAAMETFLTKRSSIGWRLDSFLAVYLQRLPSDSLLSLRVRKLVFDLAPTIFSKAYSIARKDTASWNQAWRTLTPEQRKEYISKTKRKSMTAAIMKKSELMAESVARFASGRQTNTRYDTSARRYLYQMIGYYIKVKDTLSYLPAAIQYFNRFYMPVKVEDFTSADSIKQVEYYAAALYKGARLFYYSTRDSSLLRQALAWIEKSLSFKETHQNLNIQARLLYTLNNPGDAIRYETKALQLAKDIPFYNREYGSTLAKMKKGEAIN